MSCASNHLCLIADEVGNVLSTTHPTAPATAWRSTTLNPALAITGISCAHTGFCAAVGAGSYVATSTRPTAATSEWRLTNLNLFSDDGNAGPQPDLLSGISCASSTLCVAIRQSLTYNLELSTNPAASQPHWTPRLLRGHTDTFATVSCPSRSLCAVAGGQDGAVATSTDAGKHWKFTYSDPPDPQHHPERRRHRVPTSRFCLAADSAGNVITTHDAAGGRRAWHRSRLPQGHVLSTVSCASQTLCAGIDQRGRLLLSTRPTGPGSTWKLAAMRTPVAGLSCPSTTLCVLITRDGNVVIGQRRR